MKLGTVLPTRESLANSDAYAARVAAMQRRIGNTLPGERRQVGDETRYYDSPTTWAVVSRNGKVLRFEVREDGYEYAIR